MRVGWLDSWCPWHVGPDDPERFSVRGSFGLSAAYSLRFLGPCLPPELLDIPVISAFAAARRMGVLGLIAAGTGGYLLKKAKDKRSRERKVLTPVEPVQKPVRGAPKTA